MRVCLCLLLSDVRLRGHSFRKTRRCLPSNRRYFGKKAWGVSEACTSPTLAAIIRLRTFSFFGVFMTERITRFPWWCVRMVCLAACCHPQGNPRAYTVLGGDAIHKRKSAEVGGAQEEEDGESQSCPY